ncbi:hypothetical protein CEXT_525371 [Caerostris extrusa]|uniref:Uncharacterized protein n=1 Tax=Caerostris extrusa TaxID=172846 RepID=A0AAV4MPG2_CAEEX|nr:hypothetical protein CEXT_525371 [Caerostris extrusa]
MLGTGAKGPSKSFVPVATGDFRRNPHHRASHGKRGVNSAGISCLTATPLTDANNASLYTLRLIPCVSNLSKHNNPLDSLFEKRKKEQEDSCSPFILTKRINSF